MRFHILTLFPDMVQSGLSYSITGRAIAKGAISVETVNIRDFSEDSRHRHVDDAPYGGGAGMVMQAGPVCGAYESVCARLERRPRLIYLSPQGRVFDQAYAGELAQEEELVFLCGHYEGIDERALELTGAELVSIGDYVLTGGELPAMVMIDCISRLVPGVLGKLASAEEESFCDGLLEYPQYTRPEVYQGRPVPEVLLTGHHKNIEEWRRRQSIQRTLRARPDLLAQARLTLKEREYLEELQRENQSMQERSQLEELERLVEAYAAAKGRRLLAESGSSPGEPEAKGKTAEALPAAHVYSEAREKRRAQARNKKLLAAKTCTVEELKTYYRIQAQMEGVL